MKAGLECDVLVATEVMGWKEKEDKYGNRVVVDGDGDEFYMGFAYMGEVVHDFRPSEDISHAWMVVEKIKDRGYKPELIDFSGKKGWTCHFFIPKPNIGYYEANHESAPMAICLAALRAVGVETEEFKNNLFKG